MRDALVVGCASVLLLLVGCSGEKSTPPGGGGGGASGKDRTVNIYKESDTACGVDAAVLVLRKSKKDRVRWNPEDRDVGYTIVFTGENPVQDQTCLDIVPNRPGKWCDVKQGATETLDRYEIHYTGQQAPCKKDGAGNPLDDPGLNVKH